MKPRVVIVSVLVIALVAAGAAGIALGLNGGDDQPSAEPPPAEVTEAPDPALQEFYDQTPDWQPCRQDSETECAQLTVPLDYSDPEGETIELALLKVPAAEPDRRIGSLVVNPGGPGAPGTSYAAMGSMAFGAPVHQAYDIVGFDPRGTGQSAPVDCLDDDALDAYNAVDLAPDDAAELRTVEDTNRAMAEGCAAAAPVAAHVSTVEAARDMDVLRAALWEPKLAYLGASYGTKLGATYASLFPEKSGRLVLDAALDPTASTEELNLTQAKGFEVALRSYVANCVDQGDCFLGKTVEDGLDEVQFLLGEIDHEPLPTDDPERDLTIGYAFYGLILPLYSESSWPMLDTALQQAQQADGTELLALADMYASRSGDEYTDNSVEANWAINCLDSTDAWTPAQVRKALPKFEKASPTFGETLAWMTTGCADQELTAAEPAPEISADGAEPIVVIGSTRDPATPMRWAEELSDMLEPGVLIQRDGDGHGGYNVGNACVDDAVQGYLIDGKAPDDGLRC